MLDLSKYQDQILYPEDQPLFLESIKACSCGALRAAYVMIWLACAESLKRRFQEAQKRDGSAGKIVGDIDKKEKEYKAVDHFLLEKAKEYGFLSESGYLKLKQVYEMRCVYGHPYEEDPTEEQVANAASLVINHVLSKPVTLKHGFCKQLLTSLLEDSQYLDNQSESVEEFAKEVLMKIDGEVYPWFLKTYWSELEEIALDASVRHIFRRGIWFTQTLLREIGTGIFSANEWHEQVSVFPKTFIRVFSDHHLYSEIGKLAQDSLVGQIIKHSDNKTGLLRTLESLLENGVLSKRQEKRFLDYIGKLELTKLYASGIGLDHCFEILILEMKSHNWYRQNPAVDFIRSNGAIEIDRLPAEQQVILGRNILQSAEGSASSAISLIQNLTSLEEPWPVHFLKGLFLECFINEHNEIRFKNTFLSEVLEIINNCDDEIRTNMVEELSALIKTGTFKYSWICEEDVEDVLKEFSEYDWTSDLQQILKSKMPLIEKS